MKEVVNSEKHKRVKVEQTPLPLDLMVAKGRGLAVTAEDVEAMVVVDAISKMPPNYSLTPNASKSRSGLAAR